MSKSSSIIVPEHLKAHFNRAEVLENGGVKLDTLRADRPTTLGVLMGVPSETYIITRKGDRTFTARGVFATQDHVKLRLAELVHAM